MIILLDIDGVMVPAKGWKRPALLDDGFPVFSSKATYALQQLLSKDAIVMLTTSHKSNYSIDEWKSIFKKRGIHIENLGCLPFNTTNKSRKEEIINWYTLNSTHQNFVIIDDDKSLNELPFFLKERLVQTSPHIGLTEQHLPLVKGAALA